ncbi:MAG: hypothetical protein QMD46_13920 [Methanomicrobiales archaeon]|nr:hypothetical protein [Methanomicrobiales archaeon]
MTKEVRITDYACADDTDLRSLSADIGSGKIVTPVKTINPRDFYTDTKFPRNLTNLHEIYLKFNEESLQRMNENKAYSMQRNKEVSRSREIVHHCPSLCFVEFKTRGQVGRYPTAQEIDILTNAAYSYSDITPIPSVPKMARSINRENFGEFLQYISSCIESIEVRNKKCILGYIPSAAALYTQKIVDFYLDHGINAYYIDFDGTMVQSHLDSLNALKRRLAARGYEENNFLSYFNVSFGKAINDQNVLSARDLLAYGYGLDCLGGNHVGPKRNPEFYEWLKARKSIARNTTRLLNIRDYGYYRADLLGEAARSIYPDGALIGYEESLSATPSRQKRLLQIVNLQQQCLEAETLRGVINESGDASLDYFSSKKNVVKGDLKGLARQSGR